MSSEGGLVAVLGRPGDLPKKAVGFLKADLGMFKYSSCVPPSPRSVRDNIEAISDKVLTLNDITNDNMANIEDKLDVQIIKLKKLENALKNLKDKFNDNSLLLLDQRWKNIDLDELLREFQKKE